jgi:hypothetical protein
VTLHWRGAGCLFALLAVLTATGCNTLGSPAAYAFPFPDEYRYPSDYFEYCSLEIDATGTFQMEGMHCPHSDEIDRRYALIQRVTGQARITGNYLRLDYEDPELAGAKSHRLFLLVHCDGGLRFVTDDEQRTVALAIHSADSSSLRVDGGFIRRGSSPRGNCDPRPLSPDLARIARTPPIRATIRSVESSQCSKDEEAYDCWATVRIDRGARSGIVRDMTAYSLPCDKSDKYVMTVSEISPDSATLEVNSRPAVQEGGEGLIGTGVTTRIPGCLASEYKRWEQEAEENRK